MDSFLYNWPAEMGQFARAKRGLGYNPALCPYIVRAVQALRLVILVFLPHGLVVKASG
jgi:hypothetical protein